MIKLVHYWFWTYTAFSYHISHKYQNRFLIIYFLLYKIRCKWWLYKIFMHRCNISCYKPPLQTICIPSTYITIMTTCIQDMFLYVQLPHFIILINRSTSMFQWNHSTLLLTSCPWGMLHPSFRTRPWQTFLLQLPRTGHPIRFPTHPGPEPHLDDTTCNGKCNIIIYILYGISDKAINHLCTFHNASWLEANIGYFNASLGTYWIEIPVEWPTIKAYYGICIKDLSGEIDLDTSHNHDNEFFQE